MTILDFTDFIFEGIGELDVDYKLQRNEVGVFELEETKLFHPNKKNIFLEMMKKLFSDESLKIESITLEDRFHLFHAN